MQENNFEGKVQHIMEEFTLTPSEKVWEKIQADIAAQNKRKFAWLPAALLFSIFLLSTFILHDLEKRQHTIVTAIASVTIATEQPASAISGYLNKKEIVPEPKKNKTQKVLVSVLNQMNLNETKNLVAVGKDQTKETNAPVTAIDISKDKVIQQQEIQHTENTVSIKINDAAAEADITDSTTTATVAETHSINTSSDVTGKEKKQEQKLNNTTAAAKQKKNNKWDYFIAASAGKFSTGNSYLGHIANTAYYYSDALSNSAGGPNNNALFRPAPIKPGLSFSVIVKANRRITPTTSISIGLGYQHANTSVTTGQLIAQGAGQGSGANARDSFATGNVNIFNNQYQFIQFPLEVQSMIGKGNKLPLHWNAGLMFSRLISANVLQFDNAQNRYYKDNSLVNKNSIGISAGLSLVFLKNRQAHWLIGPQFYYSLTPVAGKGLYDNTHYSFLGLQIQKKL